MIQKVLGFNTISIVSKAIVVLCCVSIAVATTEKYLSNNSEYTEDVRTSALEVCSIIKMQGLSGFECLNFTNESPVAVAKINGSESLLPLEMYLKNYPRERKSAMAFQSQASRIPQVNGYVYEEIEGRKYFAEREFMWIAVQTDPDGKNMEPVQIDLKETGMPASASHSEKGSVKTSEKNFPSEFSIVRARSDASKMFQLANWIKTARLILLSIFYPSSVSDTELLKFYSMSKNESIKSDFLKKTIDEERVGVKAGNYVFVFQGRIGKELIKKLIKNNKDTRSVFGIVTERELGEDLYRTQIIGPKNLPSQIWSGERN